MRLAAALVFASALLVTEIAIAQAPAGPAPQFDVASIKRNTSDGPSNYWQISGRRFIGNKSQIVQLLRMAWGDMQLRVENAPDWVVADRYDVIANAGGDIAPGSRVLSQMMRALLIERFQLSAHVETRETPIFALVLARSDREFGPRLQSPTPGCPLLNGATVVEAPGCGSGVSAGRMIYGSTSMAGLALNISRQVGRRVIDETGLAGGYKVDLEFTPQRLDAGPVGPNQALPALPDGPTIFEALQQQLGLKLEPRRGSMNVLVIDRIERPTPD